MIRRVKRTIALFTLPFIAATFVMSAAPAAHAAPAASASAAVLGADGELSAEFIKEIEAGVAAELAAEGSPAEQASPNTRAVPPVLVGVITLCAGAALGSVGQSVIRNLIAQGNVGRARDLLAEAAAGCVFGVAGGAAGAACRLIPPCKRAVTTAIQNAVKKIIDELS